jgi:hypothetical protein
MTTPEPVTGRCLCGAIEIRLEPPTDFLAFCHCRSCRLSHGAPFVAWTSVPLDRFAFVKGEERVRWYRSSRTIRWGFCEECGSRMLYRADETGHPEAPKTDRVYVAAACLEGVLDREVGAHVSYEERVPWYSCADALPKYRGKGVERID